MSGQAIRFVFLFFASGLLALGGLTAQDRLPTMPGYENYQKLTKETFGQFKGRPSGASWKDDGKAVEFRSEGKTVRYDIATDQTIAVETPKEKTKGDPAGGGRFPPDGAGRGRQAAQSVSPDGKFKASYRDRNVWISDAEGLIEMPVTSDGGEKSRVKNGTASWVYGEELFQRTAMWWSSDSKRLAFYRFDETNVTDYYLTRDQTALIDKLETEPYPKAGGANPVVDLLVYDLVGKKTTRVDVRDGKPFADDVVGHYVYRVSWSPDGKELLFERTNRLQNILELVAADPTTGKCRVVAHDEWPASWVENLPFMRFLKDNRRFIRSSEKTGWKNLYLHDLDGKLLNPLTSHEFEVGTVLRVDEEAGQIYYTARSGDNPMKLQLHRVGLDGKGDIRLTDPSFLHAIDFSPDGKFYLDTYQTHATPPATRLCSADGKVVAELVKPDASRSEKLGQKPSELFTFKAADGATDLYGLLHFPSNFDPAKKYPLLVSVYAGPATNGARETYSTAPAIAEFGFLVASLDSRSAGGRGKKFLDAIYGKLGVVEIDDQAVGVKALWERSYVEKNRTGIYGTSYGGYASILCLLRHPDVFQAACASSPVTDYRLYDSIYTERYLGLPKDNKAGYDAGSAVVHAGKLKGRLMLYYGTADNNVHPSNSLQLIRALQRAGKSFDLQVGPDAGHSGISQPRMMEFFVENLILAK